MELLHRNCPVCHIEFFPLDIGDQNIEICNTCKGMFFEYDEMSSSLQKATTETFTQISYGDNLPERTHELDCPKCGNKMYQCEYAFSKIHIDRCDVCTSIFLDAGEQESIRKYLASMESPDVEKANDEKFEQEYQEEFRKMARSFLDIALEKIEKA